MRDGTLTVETVTPATVREWTACTGEPSEQRQRAILEQMESRPAVARHFVRKGPVAVAGFVTEHRPPGMTVWAPWMARGLAAAEMDAVQGEVMRFLVAHAAGRGVGFLECTMLVPDDDGLWPRSLLASGFGLVSTKYEWQLDLKGAPAAGMATTERIAWPHPQAEEVFKATLVSSLDPTSVFEARYGIGLSPFDFAHLAWPGEEAAGLCACFARPGDASGWIGYIGVRPQWRGRGIAGRLASEALASLRGLGVVTARALIDIGNAPSIALHRGLGFERTSTRGDIYYRAL